MCSLQHSVAIQNTQADCGYWLFHFLNATLFANNGVLLVRIIFFVSGQIFVHLIFLKNGLFVQAKARMDFFFFFFWLVQVWLG